MPPKQLSYSAIDPLDVLNLGPVNIKSENAREVQLFGIIKGLVATVSLLRSELDALKPRVDSLQAEVDNVSDSEQVMAVKPVFDTALVEQTVVRVVTPMISEAVKPSSVDVESSVRGVVEPMLKVLVDPVVSDVQKLKDDCVKLREDVDYVGNGMNTNWTAISKVEQYSRRGTITVVGLPQRENENVVDEICTLLNIKESDLEAAHRNSNKPITFKNSKGDTVSKPPSITVRFSNLNKKDSVLRSYKNYQNGNAKSIRVYQSLTETYKNIKQSITDYCKELQVELAWIHWRSASAGLVVKIKSTGKLISKIFCHDDFVNQYTGIVKK